MRLDPRVREAVVAAVLEVREEVPDDRDGDEEAHVVGAREALEGDAHHPAVLDHRAAAVARVDGGVGLHDEVRVGAAVHVPARLDARDDAGGRGDVLPAEREAVGHDAGAGAREGPEGQGTQPAGESGVFHPEHGEVAVVPHRLERRDVRVRLVGAPHEDLARVGDDVGVRHDPSAGDEEAAAGGAAHPFLPPGLRPVEGRAEHLDVHDGGDDPVATGRDGDRGRDGCRGAQGNEQQDGGCAPHRAVSAADSPARVPSATESGIPVLRIPAPVR